jgi:uncharacterized membrane protein
VLVYRKWYRWLMRLVLTFSIAANLNTVRSSDDIGWMPAIALVSAGFVAWCWFFCERVWRRTDARRWDLAAASDDPIAWMASHEYLMSLSSRQQDQFLKEIEALGDDFASVPVDDLPPLLRGYRAALNEPPREP